MFSKISNFQCRYKFLAIFWALFKNYLKTFSCRFRLAKFIFGFISSKIPSTLSKSIKKYFWDKKNQYQAEFLEILAPEAITLYVFRIRSSRSIFNFSMYEFFIPFQNYRKPISYSFRLVKFLVSFISWKIWTMFPESIKNGSRDKKIHFQAQVLKILGPGPITKYVFRISSSRLISQSVLRILCNFFKNLKFSM